GPCAATPYSFLLLVAPSASAAEQGKWSLGMPYTTQVFPDEWDTAELPNGDLLAVMRTDINGENARRQAILRRQGSGWVMDQPRPLPDIPALAPSGHPSLLAVGHG